MENKGYNGKQGLQRKTRVMTENKGYDRKQGLRRRTTFITENRVYNEERRSSCKMTFIVQNDVHRTKRCSSCRTRVIAQNEIHRAKLSSFRISGDHKGLYSYREVCFEGDNIIISTAGSILHRICKNLSNGDVCDVKKHGRYCPEWQSKHLQRRRVEPASTGSFFLEDAFLVGGGSSSSARGSMSSSGGAL